MATSATTARSRSRLFGHQPKAYLYLLPAFAFYTAFVTYPFVRTIWLSLHGGSGMDVLRELHNRNHHANRVVLTNYATPDIRSRCTGLGASRVFDKSSEIDELVEYCIQLANEAPPRGGLAHAS